MQNSHTHKSRTKIKSKIRNKERQGKSCTRKRIITKPKNITKQEQHDL